MHCSCSSPQMDAVAPKWVLSQDLLKNHGHGVLPVLPLEWQSTSQHFKLSTGNNLVLLGTAKVMFDSQGLHVAFNYQYVPFLNTQANGLHHSLTQDVEHNWGILN